MIPKTRTEWWRSKLEGNRKRDERNVSALRALGWNVIVVWQCEIPRILASLPGMISDAGTPGLTSGIPAAPDKTATPGLQFGQTPGFEPRSSPIGTRMNRTGSTINKSIRDRV
jgi:hypothetical protein